MNMTPISHTDRRWSAAFGRLTTASDRFACFMCIALFMTILVVLIMQVTFRYILNSPLTWTEELSRILYIWACYMGATVAFRRGNHVTIMFLRDRLPRCFIRPLMLSIQAISLFFFIVLAILGASLAIRSHSTEAITLPIPWSVIYLATPIAAVIMALQTIEAFWKTLTENQKEFQA